MSGKAALVIRLALAVAVAICWSFSGGAQGEQWVTYKGGAGPGKGKKIVFVTGDEEYRSEESMPAMARILAQRHGFRTVVLFSINRNTGEIDPTVTDNIPGLDELKDADLMVVFTRFRHLPEDQMAKFVDYVDSGRPIIGIRTATHAFDYDKFQGEKFSEWAWRGPRTDFKGGFGRQVLGETWVGHHGGYRTESTLGMVVPAMKDHPILRGIDRLWGVSHAYKVTTLEGDSQPLLMGQPLLGLKKDDKPDEGKPPVPVAWIKTFTGSAGKAARVFTTTMGYGDDFKEESVRRLFVNACYWAVGLEDQIPAKSNVALVGSYTPRQSDFGGYRKGVKPIDLQQNLSTDELADVPANDREAEYYRIVDVPMPPDGVMEAGSVLRAARRPARGRHPAGRDLLRHRGRRHPPAPQWKLFATGLDGSPRPRLARRHALRHAAERGDAHPRHRRRRPGRPVRDGERRLGVGRRARVHVRLRLRPRRRDLDRPRPDRQLHVRPPVPRLGAAPLPRRPMGADVQRPAQPRRRSRSTRPATPSTPRARGRGTAPVR